MLVKSNNGTLQKWAHYFFGCCTSKLITLPVYRLCGKFQKLPSITTTASQVLNGRGHVTQAMLLLAMLIFTAHPGFSTTKRKLSQMCEARGLP